MSRSAVPGLFSLVLMLFAAIIVQAQEVPELEYDKYVLDNGLQVILHEDHTIPIVAVNVWYHVGSKNEKPGRTGFAHLFEHMMFQGSENHDSDYFFPLQKIGAAVNGSTNEDRTNYWENVPSDQLELALWLESDRMGFLLPAMTQEKFENQQDVVKNEKRQGENQPYAKNDELLKKLLYPNEHPYSWTVIGSMDDLTAASLEDVKDFFRLYYAPNNASLCIAGDFEPARAKELVQKYFAPIPPGRPVDRIESWISELEGERRTIAEDDVELPRLYYAWNTPAYYQPGDAEFDLLSTILTDGKISRLYKTLVYDLQIAQDVTSYQDSRELGSNFVIQATARPGHSLAELEEVIDAELAKIAKKGVTKKELELAKTSWETGFIRGLQRIGGFGGKADRLNRYNVFTGDPDYLAKDLQRYREVTAADVQEYARRFMDLDHRAVLHIIPQGSLQAADSEPDRSTQPPSSGQPVFTPPKIQTATLDNGLELYLVQKRELPLVEIRLCIKSGWAVDPPNKPGTAALTAELLDEGTRSRNALQISEEAQRLGAELNTGSFFDGSLVTLNILKRNLQDGLTLMGDLLLNPTFPDEELERQRQIYLGRIQQESMQPQVAAIKLFQRRVFGGDHPYAQPFTGTGTEASLAVLTRDDLTRYHAQHYLPNNTAAIVVGDITLAEAKDMLAEAFQKWEKGTVVRQPVPAAAQESGARVCVVNRPGAQQSVIIAGHLSMTRNNPDFLAFQVTNRNFGGQFISRVNMNLREEKGYTYGARTQMASFRESGVFFCSAPVHTQYTKESLVEILKEINDVRGERPLTDTEILDAKNSLTMGFPQDFETYGRVAGQLFNLVLYDLPLDDWQTYLHRVNDVNDLNVQRIVHNHIRPDDLIFVIIGDWEKIESGVRELDLGEIDLIDASAL